jgi:hypothetical protein
MKILHPLLSIVLALGGLACAADLPGGAPNGIVYAPGQPAATPQGLHLLRWEPFKSTFVKPGADLQRYDKVMIDPVTLSYKTPPRPGVEGGDMIIKNYALPESAIQDIEKAFHKAFVTELGKSPNFTVVKAPGPDVLLISPRIVDLVVTAPPQQQDQELGTSYGVASAGRMTLVLEAQDSQSHEALVAVAQTRSVQTADNAFYSSNPATNSAAVREILRAWADSLRQELDQFHSLPRLPALPAADIAPPQ